MASWANKPPTGISNRRKWNLEDRASLNNLKFHFAADGCSDVQYDLAKQLLENTSDLDEAASQIQGVHWLLCAAQQGHEDALEMLRDCYKNRRGITESNENEVETFLTMSSGERAARKAARDLFACLSNGGEHITPKQLERKMREIYKLQKKRRRRNESTSTSDEEECVDNDSPNKIHANGYIYLSTNRSRKTELNLQEPENLITEANLVSAAVNYSHGLLPVVNNSITLSVPHPSSLDHVPCFHRLLFHPLLFFTLLYHRFVNLIAIFPDSVLANLKILLLFVFYTLVSSDNLTVFLPMVFYYLCLAVMLWSTCKMLKTKHDFIDFRVWSGLFLSYGDNNVEATESENQFLKNNMKPYWYFFCAFVGNLLIYPLISSEWLPHSEITVVSFTLVFVTMIAFMYTSAGPFPDILILCSFGLNVLAKYPYEMDDVVSASWRFLDLKWPTFCSFVIGNGIEFCLNCRTALYLLIPGFLINLARRSNWNGTYTYLFPHCVTLTWLQICITSSQSATMFGLLRAFLGISGALLFLPLFGILTLLIPVFATIEWMGLTDSKIRLGMTFLTAAFALLGSCLMAVNKNAKKYVTGLQVIVCLVGAALLSLPYMTSNFKNEHTDTLIYDHMVRRKPPTMVVTEPLTWEKYYNYCGQPAWEHQNRIKTQIRCSELEGTTVQWEGSVVDVEIVHVTNWRAQIIKNYLPKWLSQLTTCFFGDRNELHCLETENSCDALHKLFKQKRDCNLNRWNQYEYEIKVRMHSGLLTKPAMIYLRANNYFKNFTEDLRGGDRISFEGKLLNSAKMGKDRKTDFVLGTNKAAIDLTRIECAVCVDKKLTSIAIEDKSQLAVDGRMLDLMRGFKYLLNVLFNPLITFK